MDIEFIVQDTFALTRPQWKLASNLEEAVKALQLAIAQDKKTAALDKSLDGDDASVASSSDDQHMEHDLHDGEGEDSSESEDEDAEVSIKKHGGLGTWGLIKSRKQEGSESVADSASSEEKIVVTRPEEEVDPEEEAEFQREYAKMMAESLESRKFERKPLFDLPLPVRAKNKESALSGDGGEEGASSPIGTMSISLLTKKGNRQQVWTGLGKILESRLLTPDADSDCGSAF